MPIKPLPIDHHVARLCGHQKLNRAADGTIESVSPAAFALRLERDPPEKYSSATWLEHFNGDTKAQLQQTLAAYRSKMKIKASSALLRLAVKEILDCGVKCNRKLRVLHEPKQWNPAYAAVRGLPLDNSDQELLALISRAETLSVHEVGALDHL